MGKIKNLTQVLAKQMNNLPKQNRQDTAQSLSNINKPVPKGFITLENFSKMLDDKITAHYEKLPDSYCPKSI